jgi:hypothetical protein
MGALDWGWGLQTRDRGYRLSEDGGYRLGMRDRDVLAPASAPPCGA